MLMYLSRINTVHLSPSSEEEKTNNFADKCNCLKLNTSTRFRGRCTLIVATLYLRDTLCLLTSTQTEKFSNCVKKAAFWRPLEIHETTTPNFVFFVQWDGHSMIVHLSSNSIRMELVKVVNGEVFWIGCLSEVCMGIRQGLIHAYTSRCHKAVSEELPVDIELCLSSLFQQWISKAGCL